MTATAGMLGEATPDIGARPTALLPDPPAGPDLALLAGPDGDRRRGRPVRHATASSSTTSCPQDERRDDAVPGRHRRLDRRDHRPADRRLHQRLHGQPLGPAQAVHRVRLAARRRVPARHRDLQHGARCWRRSCILLSFSTNIARGPFQGYVPDLVAEPQVGLASGLVGMMQIVGNVTGLRARVARRSRTATMVARPARGRDRRARHDAQRRAAGRARACRRSRARAGRGRGSPARPGRPTSSRSGPTSGCSSRGCCS